MNRYAAEFTGTFMLVFIGCGAAAVNSMTQGPGHIGVCIAFGLTVTAVIYSLGNVSGAHINPAVTTAFLISGKLKAKEFLPYVLSQFTGAAVAGFALRFIFPEAESLGVTLPSGDWYRIFILEVIISMILMLIILNIAHGYKEEGIMAGAAIGGYIIAAAIFAGPVSGGSMNPARSFGPAVASLNFEHLWIYLTAPVIGTSAAVPAWRFLQKVK